MSYSCIVCMSYRKTACCNPESGLVTWRNQCVDDRKVEYRRPGSLDINMRIVSVGKCCSTSDTIEDLRPFRDTNSCRAACTVQTDLRRYLDRLYKTS